MIKICAVVAMAENNCIGKDNDLPWHISDDLKHFKNRTLGKPVIMGRKTMESIIARLGKPLPGRENIVVSRSGYQARGVEVYPDIEAALQRATAIAASKSIDEIIIGGGAQIYELALPFTDRLYLTKVHQAVDGDAFFPKLNETAWKEISREDRDGPPPYSWLTWDRA